MDDGRPIFLQVGEQLESSILDGSLPAGAQVPSINEIAAFHRINPATALKGVSRLVDAGVLYKRRGIGMFVAEGARERLLHERRLAFQDEFIAPLLHEAARLGITADEVSTMIRKDTAS